MLTLTLALFVSLPPAPIIGFQSLLDPGLEQVNGSVQPFGGYQSSPGLVTVGDTLSVIFRRAPVHGGSYAGDSTLRMRQSIDGGSGWIHNRTNELVVEPGIVGVDPYTAQIFVRPSDGHWFLTWERDYAPGGQYARLVWWKESADNGATWSAPQQFPVPTIFPSSYVAAYVSAGGPCIEAPDGATLCPAYYRSNQSSSVQRPFVYRSTSGFSAFEKAGEVPSFGPLNLEEPVLASCGGEVIMLIRNDDYGQIVLSRSIDGLVWTAPITVFTGIGLPSVSCDGTTCLSVARETNKEVLSVRDGKPAARVSEDCGRTWSEPTYLGYPQNPETRIASLYQQIVRRGDRRWGVAYAQESPASTGGVRLAYAEVYARDPQPGEIPPLNRGTWTATSGLVGPIYADYGAVPALHSASRLACGWWYRNDANWDMEYPLRYGSTAGNGSNSFYAMIQPYPRRWEISIASTVSSFDRVYTEGYSSHADIWEAVYFSFDAGSLRLWQNAQEQTLVTQGTIPAVMTSPTNAILRIGAQANGLQHLRGSLLDHIACWIGSAAPTGFDRTTQAIAWWNNGTPRAPVGASFFCPLDDSFVCSGLPEPIVTGTARFTNQRQAGPGYLSP